MPKLSAACVFLFFHLGELACMHRAVMGGLWPLDNLRDAVHLVSEALQV